MSTNACPKECPICMDDIMEVNFVITECGHTFHTSCLMKNAAHNGFGCPYCRAVMAEVPEDDEDDESSVEEDDDSSSEEEEEEEPFSNQSLSGMRWLFLSAENLPLSEDDEEDEEEEDDEEELPTPTSELVAQKLQEENITYQDLVISLLAINHEEYENKEEYQKKEDEVYDKIQVIISNFRTPPLPVQEPAEPILELVAEEEKTILQTQEKETILEEEEVKVEVIPNKIDFSAQPKERKNKKIMFENSLL